VNHPSTAEPEEIPVVSDAPPTTVDGLAEENRWLRLAREAIRDAVDAPGARCVPAAALLVVER